MKTKNMIIIAMIFLIISLLIFFYTGSVSLDTVGLTDSLDNCRIVMDGNVCDTYTQCQYDSTRLTSCIKGYELTQGVDGSDASPVSRGSQYVEY